MSTLRISQLAERTGVPVTTLRFYEETGLLPAGRTAAGYRIWNEDAVERLAFIGAAKRLGLPLEEIAELLGVWVGGSCARVRADLRPRIVGRIAVARERSAELAAFVGTLHRTVAHLDALPDRAEPCDPTCGFPAGPALPGGDVPMVDDAAWRSAPVACSLSGEGIAQRTEAWKKLLVGAVAESVPDGVRLSLPTERAGEVAALAAAEQECCPFFGFRLHLGGGRLVLEVRAPIEGAGLLAELFTPAC